MKVSLTAAWKESPTLDCHRGHSIEDKLLAHSRVQPVNMIESIPDCRSVQARIERSNNRSQETRTKQH